MPTDEEKRFLDAWRFAGPELERMRNESLRELDDKRPLRLLGAYAVNRQSQNGLATFQAWMMRLRVIELLKAGNKST